MFDWFELNTLRINFNDTTNALKGYGKYIDLASFAGLPCTGLFQIELQRLFAHSFC